MRTETPDQLELLRRERLSLSLAGTLRAPTSEPDSARSQATTSGPAAEWLAALRTADGPYSILLGAGTGLPLAREERESDDDQAVLAPTAPALRALLRLSYTPEP